MRSLLGNDTFEDTVQSGDLMDLAEHWRATDCALARSCSGVDREP